MTSFKIPVSHGTWVTLNCDVVQEVSDQEIDPSVAWSLSNSLGTMRRGKYHGLDPSFRNNDNLTVPLIRGKLKMVQSSVSFRDRSVLIRWLNKGGWIVRDSPKQPANGGRFVTMRFVCHFVGNHIRSRKRRRTMNSQTARGSASDCEELRSLACPCELSVKYDVLSKVATQFLRSPQVIHIPKMWW